MSYCSLVISEHARAIRGEDRGSDVHGHRLLCWGRHQYCVASTSSIHLGVRQSGTRWTSHPQVRHWNHVLRLVVRLRHGVLTASLRPLQRCRLVTFTTPPFIVYHPLPTVATSRRSPWIHVVTTVSDWWAMQIETTSPIKKVINYHWFRGECSRLVYFARILRFF